MTTTTTTTTVLRFFLVANSEEGKQKKRKRLDDVREESDVARWRGYTESVLGTDSQQMTASLLTDTASIPAATALRHSEGRHIKSDSRKTSLSGAHKPQSAIYRYPQRFSVTAL